MCSQAAAQVRPVTVQQNTLHLTEHDFTRRVMHCCCPSRMCAESLPACIHTQEHIAVAAREPIWMHGSGLNNLYIVVCKQDKGQTMAKVPGRKAAAKFACGSSLKVPAQPLLQHCTAASH